MRASIIIWRSNGIYQRPQTSMLHIGTPWYIHMDSSLPCPVNEYSSSLCLRLYLSLSFHMLSFLPLYMNIQHLCVFFWSKWRPGLFGVGGNVHLKTCIYYFVSLFNLHHFSKLLKWRKWKENKKLSENLLLLNAIFRRNETPHILRMKEKSLKDSN